MISPRTTVFIKIRRAIALAVTIIPSLVWAQSLQNLGPQIQSITFDSSILFRSGASTHWLSFHDIVNGAGNTQLFHVNLSTGASYVVNTAQSGRGNVYGKIVSALNGYLYFTTNDPCHFYEYHLDGTIRQIVSPGWAANACGSSGTDKAGEVAAQGPNGSVLIGTAVRGTLFSYDPTAGQITDYGVIDAPSGNPTCTGCYRYVYSLQADSRYAYLGMRDANTNIWWLVMVRLADGQQTSCFAGEAQPTGFVYRRTSDNAVVYQKGSSYWYLLDGTQGCPTSTIAAPTVNPWYMPGPVYFEKEAPGHEASLFNVDVDISNAPADSSTGGATTVGYRNPAGAGVYVYKSGLLTLYPANLRRTFWDGSNVQIASGSYGPDGAFSGSSTRIQGRISSESTYAIGSAGGYLYYSGYPSVTYRYDPLSLWTLTGSNAAACTVVTPSNPCIAVTAWGKYHYYSGTGSDGRLYVATSYERQTAAGGEIGWINPADNSTGSYRIGSMSLTCDSPLDWAPLQNGAKFVYSSNADGGYFGCANTRGQLFLFDVPSQSVTSTLQPVPMASNQGKIVEAPDGDIVGIIRNFPSSGVYTVYKINPSTGGQASWSPMQLSGTPFGTVASYDQKLVRGPDGFIWFYDGSNVLRLDPSKGTVSTYASLAGVNWLTFAGTNVYISAGTSLYTGAVPRVQVAVSPLSVTLGVGQIQQFSATVTGTTNTAVTWSVSPAAGSISSSGLYTAPATISSAQTVTVTATGAGGAVGKASVSLAPPVVSVSPLSVTLGGGQTQRFTATVTGTTNTAVTWSISPAAGSISSSGLYTAPAAISSAQTVKVTATVLGTSASATVSLSPTSIRINSGGAAQTDTAKLNWSSDQAFTGGSVVSATKAIQKTTNGPLYQSARSGQSKYLFSAANGNYIVNFSFAELSQIKKGARVFNVLINGTIVLSNFDIVAAAGATFTALNKSIAISVWNGKIDIQFASGSAGVPLINAIEIVPSGATVDLP